jgi:hypothetical protein
MYNQYDELWLLQAKSYQFQEDHTLELLLVVQYLEIQIFLDV